MSDFRKQMNLHAAKKARWYYAEVLPSLWLKTQLWVHFEHSLKARLFFFFFCQTIISWKVFPWDLKYCPWFCCTKPVMEGLSNVSVAPINLAFVIDEVENKRGSSNASSWFSWLQVNRTKSWTPRRRCGSRFSQTYAQTASVLQPTNKLPLKSSARECAKPKPWVTLKSNKLNRAAQNSSAQISTARHHPKCCGKASQKSGSSILMHMLLEWCVQQSHGCHAWVYRQSDSEEYVALCWMDMSLTVTFLLWKSESWPEGGATVTMIMYSMCTVSLLKWDHMRTNSTQSYPTWQKEKWNPLKESLLDRETSDGV